MLTACRRTVILLWLGGVCLGQDKQGCDRAAQCNAQYGLLESGTGGPLEDLASSNGVEAGDDEELRADRKEDFLACSRRDESPRDE